MVSILYFKLIMWASSSVSSELGMVQKLHRSLWWMTFGRTSSGGSVIIFGFLNTLAVFWYRWSEYLSGLPERVGSWRSDVLVGSAIIWVGGFRVWWWWWEKVRFVTASLLSPLPYPVWYLHEILRELIYQFRMGHQ